MKKIWLILLIAGSLTWTGCQHEQTSEKQAAGQTEPQTLNAAPAPKDQKETVEITTEQFKANDMALGTVQDHEFARFIHTNGMIGIPPKNRAAVSPLYGGYVQSIDLIDGDYVRKGQVLFTLENPEYLEMQQRYLQLKEQTAYLRTEYQRQKKLYDEQISSAKTFLKTQADYKTALAEYRSLEKKLRLLGIDPRSLSEDRLRPVIAVRAPLSGYVADITVEKGAYLAPSQKAMQILNTDHKHVEIKVFEKDIPKLRKGQTFFFNLPNQPDKVYTGKIFLIGKKIDPEKRYVTVHGHIDNEKQARELLPEMFTDVKIIYDRYRAPALPESALLQEGDTYYILVKKAEKDGRLIFEKVVVKPGKHDEGFVEILAPQLSPEDQILVKGGYFLH